MSLPFQRPDNNSYAYSSSEAAIELTCQTGLTSSFQPDGLLYLDSENSATGGEGTGVGTHVSMWVLGIEQYKGKEHD